MASRGGPNQRCRRRNSAGPISPRASPASAIADGAMLLGHAHGEPVLLARRGDELFAIGAICTHYGAPLEQGLLVGDTVRCPWHHACFSLRTGEALRAPALNPVSCWRVEQQDGTRVCRAKSSTPAKPPPLPAAPGMPQIGRHRGRWRGGQCGGRDAPSRRLCRPHHDAERRCVRALRPAQPVEGLSSRAPRPRSRIRLRSADSTESMTST